MSTHPVQPYPVFQGDRELCHYNVQHSHWR